VKGPPSETGRRLNDDAVGMPGPSTVARHPLRVREAWSGVAWPFRRLLPSDSPIERTGLGLTIARSIARALGGDVVLSSVPTGGLRATVILPQQSLDLPASSGRCRRDTLQTNDEGMTAASGPVRLPQRSRGGSGGVQVHGIKK
jgi:hypothetical protein